LKSAGEYLDIAVVDHIIPTGESFFSFADDKLF
jgi:DNA repair protein RadC